MHLQRLFFRKLGQNLFPLLVDRFCHQFLTGRIEMNAIKAEFRRKVHLREFFPQDRYGSGS